MLHNERPPSICWWTSAYPAIAAEFLMTNISNTYLLTSDTGPGCESSHKGLHLRFNLTEIHANYHDTEP